jgi:hypothetical protein
VKHGEEANLRAEVLGISSNGAESLRGGAEENAVDHFFVLIGDGGDLFRHGEDDVEILDGQQFGWAIFTSSSACRTCSCR